MSFSSDVKKELCAIECEMTVAAELKLTECFISEEPSALMTSAL